MKMKIRTHYMESWFFMRLFSMDNHPYGMIPGKDLLYIGILRQTLIAYRKTA